MAPGPDTRLVVIGGTFRGVGKTALAVGIMAALRCLAPPLGAAQTFAALPLSSCGGLRLSVRRACLQAARADSPGL